jgi:hypothetical protein
LAHVTGQRIGLAGADHRLEDAPDGVVVLRFSGPDQHGLPLYSVRLGDHLLVTEAAVDCLASIAWQLEKIEIGCCSH